MPPAEYGLIPIVSMVALFSFLAAASWALARWRERQAFYRSEIVKRIAETQGESRNSALQFLREQEQIRERHRRQALRLGGLITAVVGIATMILLRGFARDPQLGVPPEVYLSGLIPLSVGLVIVVYSRILSSRP